MIYKDIFIFTTNSTSSTVQFEESIILIGKRFFLKEI